MSLCARIEEWAKAQGIDDWCEDVKKWASEELGWDEYKEIDLMTVDLGVTEVVEALREFADAPPLRELDDAELGRWVAENNGFSWADSIDELVACLGNPDPVGMKVYAPAGEETFDDIQTTEEAQAGADRREAA